MNAGVLIFLSIVVGMMVLVSKTEFFENGTHFPYRSVVYIPNEEQQPPLPSLITDIHENKWTEIGMVCNTLDKNECYPIMLTQIINPNRFDFNCRSEGMPFSDIKAIPSCKLTKTEWACKIQTPDVFTLTYIPQHDQLIKIGMSEYLVRIHPKYQGVF